MNALIAYAASFVSFLLEDIPPSDIDQIVLFGSAARGTADSESDIDLFVDTKKSISPAVQKALRLFNQSSLHRQWVQKGVSAAISVQTGELVKWKLRREILSDGIVLFSGTTQRPEGAQLYLLIQPSFSAFKKPKQVSLWRALYGYQQKAGNKTYKTAGLLADSGGKRFGNVFFVPAKNKTLVLTFLNKEQIPYTVREVWSDTL